MQAIRQLLHAHVKIATDQDSIAFAYFALRNVGDEKSIKLIEEQEIPKKSLRVTLPPELVVRRSSGSVEKESTARGKVLRYSVKR